VIQRFERLFEPNLERVIEIVQNALPLKFARLNAIEFFLHFARESDTQNIGDGLDEFVGNDFAEIR